MFSVPQIVELQNSSVELWHHQAISNPYAEPLSLVCEQHSYNFQLWHEEDLARGTQVSDTQIANVKRSIDRLNQARNDAIERIDDWLTHQLSNCNIVAQPDARANTETAGSAIDRLSILALRIYHYNEQVCRPGTSQQHQQRVAERLVICRRQQVDLACALECLLDDIQAGRAIHRTYRQFKMYNDPMLNPYLYDPSRSST